MRSPLRFASSLSGPRTFGQALADLATRIGYDVVIVDPRTAFASKERIGEIMALTDWPDISLRAVGLDARTAIVALTHVAALDDEALSGALHGAAVRVNTLLVRESPD